MYLFIYSAVKEKEKKNHHHILVMIGCSGGWGGVKKLKMGNEIKIF